VERKDKTIYFSALRNGDTENFFGAVIGSQPVDQTLVLRNIDTGATGAEIEVALQGVTDLPGIGADHQVRVVLNGTDVGRLIFDGQTHKVEKFTLSQGLLKEGNNVVTLIAEAGGTDISLVDYIRVTYSHTYAAEDDSLRMTAAPTTPSGKSVAETQTQTIGGFTSPLIRVFDITDPDAAIEVAGEVEQQGKSYAVTVDLQGQGTTTLLAVTDEKIKHPASITANVPSSLRNAVNGADLLIITRRDLFTDLEALRALRQSQGLSVMLVDVEDIFDEFSYSEKTPQAVKDFLSFAATSWKKKPRFLLMAGHASLDPKNYLGYGDSDIVSTRLLDTAFMETASDDWFVDFNDDGLAELAIGRLPFRTTGEAATMVSKILSYENSRPSEEALLVADSNDGFEFEGSSAALRALLPANLRVNQINRGRIDAETAKKQLIDAISRGQKLVNYLGHGSVNLWRGSLLTNDDARAMTNADHLSLFVMMTCLNGYFQDAALDSLGESLLKAERGGAVAVWASSGMTLPPEQALINQQLYRMLFGVGNGKSLTLGEATMRAKSVSSDPDVRRTWILLGDPTMVLK
jgi:hypothetical protein